MATARIIFDAGENVKWHKVSWDVTTPAGTIFSVKIRTADTEGGLAGAIWRILTIMPSYFREQGRWVEIECGFTGDGGATAVLNSLCLTYGPWTPWGASEPPATVWTEV